MLMSKTVFDNLSSANVELAWSLIGKEVLKCYTGRYVTPVPFFNSTKCPCGPGYIILTERQSFWDWLKRKSPYRVFTECLWDFHPNEDTDTPESQKRIIRTKTVYDYRNSHFLYEATRTRNGNTKTIRVIFHGKRVTSLEPVKGQLFGVRIHVDLLDDTLFDTDTLCMVHQVYSIDRGHMEVWVNNDVATLEMDALTPIGFKMLRLWIGYKHDCLRVLLVTFVKSKKFKAKWRNRYFYKQVLHNFVPNQRKYGGESGDVNGPGNRPFSFNQGFAPVPLQEP